MHEISRSRRLAAAVAAGALLGTLACGEPATTAVADESLQDLTADLVLYDMSTYVTSKGVRQAQIQADSAYSYQDSAVVHLMGVDMTIYGERGETRATVTARKGRIDQKSQMLTAQGDVVLRIPDQDRIIQGPELNYDPNGDRIWSDSTTTMREGSRTTTGTCFRSDLQFKNFTVCNIRGAAGAIATPGDGG